MILRLFNYAMGAALLCSTAFWITSYSHYNSLGIDSEQIADGTVDYHYYRIWWPGNGAVLIGRGITAVEYDAEKHYELFDLGAAFFRTQDKKLEPRTLWNKIGFWYINPAAPVRQFWLGIPAWLPVILLSLYLYFFGQFPKQSKT